MSKKPSVLDDVKSAIASAAPKLAVRWFQRVAPEHQPVLDELAAAWKSGELGTTKRTAAKAIGNVLRVRGIANIGHNGVEAWLDELP